MREEDDPDLRLYKQYIIDVIDKKRELLNWILDKLEGRKECKEPSMYQEKQRAWTDTVFRELSPSIFKVIEGSFDLTVKKKQPDTWVADGTLKKEEIVAKENDNVMEAFLTSIREDESVGARCDFQRSTVRIGEKAGASCSTKYLGRSRHEPDYL